MTPEVGRPFLFQRAKAARRDSDSNGTSVVINTNSIDRHGTIVEPKGIDTTVYKENNVFLINHQDNLLAGNSSVDLKKDRWIAHVRDDQWHNNDPNIAPWEDKVKSGIMKMASVGILVKEVEDRVVETDEGEVSVPAIIRSELLEWSFVTIGSNRDALIQNKYMHTNDDFINKLQELHDKIDAIKNLEIKLPDYQIDNLIDTFVEKQEEMLTVRKDRAPSSGSRSDRAAKPPHTIFSIEQMREIVNETLDKKLGQK